MSDSDSSSGDYELMSVNVSDEERDSRRRTMAELMLALMPENTTADSPAANDFFAAVDKVKDTLERRAQTLLARKETTTLFQVVMSGVSVPIDALFRVFEYLPETIIIAKASLVSRSFLAATQKYPWEDIKFRSDVVSEHCWNWQQIGFSNEMRSIQHLADAKVLHLVQNRFPMLRRLTVTSDVMLHLPFTKTVIDICPFLTQIDMTLQVRMRSGTEDFAFVIYFPKRRELFLRLLIKKNLIRKDEFLLWLRTTAPAVRRFRLALLPFSPNRNFVALLETALISIADACPQLESFRLASIRGADVVILYFLRQCPKLEELHVFKLQVATLEIISKMPHNLTEFRLQILPDEPNALRAISQQTEANKARRLADKNCET